MGWVIHGPRRRRRPSHSTAEPLVQVWIYGPFHSIVSDWSDTNLPILHDVGLPALPTASATKFTLAIERDEEGRFRSTFSLLAPPLAT